MDRLLDKTMKFLNKNEDDLDDEKSDIVRYGLEIILLKVSFFIATMIVGIIMRSFWECLIFTLLFSSVRSLAGGYHARTRVKCFAQSMLTFSAVLGILKIVKVYDFIIIPLTVLALISAAVIFSFAPVDTENKRLDDEECRTFRKKARTVMFIEIVTAAVAYFIGFKSISCSVMLALIVTAILMYIEMIKNTKNPDGV